MSTLTLDLDTPRALFPGGGEMGALVRTKDWSGTPFGPVESWPQSLKTVTALMLESSFAMVVAWGPEFRFLYNNRYRPVLGNKHPFALGAPAKDIFPEVWANIIEPLFMRTRHGESVALDDLLIPLHRYGYLENCYFTIAYSPIRDETGGVGGMLAVVAETTERVESERRMTTLRELARRATDADTPAAACVNAAAIFRDNQIDVPFALLYLLDRDGSGARRVAGTGLADTHAANRDVINLAPLDAVGSEASWPLRDALRTGKAIVIEDMVQRFGEIPSAPFPEAVRSAILLPLTRPGLAQPYGFLVAAISPRRALNERYRDFMELAAEHITTAIVNASALEEERRRADALAEIDRAKTAFFSNVSHEFRTPLALMLGPLEEILATGNGSLAPEIRGQLELTHRNSLRLLKLVNTLLDFSRLEAGRLQATYEPVDLAALTAELAGVFRAAIEKAGLSLRVESEPTAERAFVDRDMWEKVVFNLLSNALKFTLRGEIAVRVRQDGTRFELTVSDTGVGVAGHELPNLFKRFHRIENELSRTHEGTGIGLALVQELVKLHGGSVAAASRVGEGTVFTVSIPAGSAHLPADRVQPSRAPASGRAGASSFLAEVLRWLPEGDAAAEKLATPAPVRSRPQAGPVPPSARIVLADDNTDMRTYVQRLLADTYTVEAVPDGRAALDAIRRERPDLVLTDIMMPRLNGIELLRAIREDAELRTVPVILLSARAGHESSIEGYDAGADDYLVKPFTARELVARVASHLKLSRLRNEVAAQADKLRAGQRSAAALAELSREIALLSDEAGIIRAAMRTVGLHLGAERCCLVENDGTAPRAIVRQVWRRDGASANESVHGFGELGGPDWQRAVANATLAVADATTHPLTRDFAARYATAGIRACVTAPLTRDGAWVATLAVTEPAPRAWTEEEISFLENVAARVWPVAEHARAIARLSAIVQSSDDAIIAKDLNGTVTSWNPGAERIFGYTAKEMNGQSILRVIPPDRHGEETTILARLRRGEHIDHYETVRRRKDGSLVDVALTVSPMRNEAGEIVGASKIARDITERRRAETQQRALYELVARINGAVDLPDIYGAALEAILSCQRTGRAAILLYDADGVMRFVGWRGLSNDYRRAVEGHSPWKHDDPDPRPVCIEDVGTAPLDPPLRAVIEREGIKALAFIPLRLEKKLLGKFMVYHDTVHRFTPDELQPIETVASQVAFAIERGKSAEALEALVHERTASLRKAIEQMEEFSYSVSHDLRSPVRAMRGYAEVILSDYGSRLDDEGRELLRRIQRNGLRMDRLIQDLLTYSRIARREIHLEPVSLDRLVREVIQQYPEMMPERATIEIRGPLPDVLAHEPSLTQVISNLLSNAVKFVAPGKRPHVRVGFDRMPSGVRLWIQDNGIGIKPEYRHRLFGMFERMHTEQKFEGTGIGLAIVRKAIERMNGTVGVELGGDGGCRFWIELTEPESR